MVWSMTQNDGTTRKFIRRSGFVQGRHVSESIQESTECIFEPSRYAYRLATYSGTALYSLGSHTPTHWSFLEIQRMNFHERILWSHMRGYYGLTWEDTMVSYERILWSIDGRCYLLSAGWQIRGVGGSVWAVKPIDVYRNSFSTRGQSNLFPFLFLIRL